VGSIEADKREEVLCQLNKEMEKLIKVLFWASGREGECWAHVKKLWMKPVVVVVVCRKPFQLKWTRTRKVTRYDNIKKNSLISGIE